MSKLFVDDIVEKTSGHLVRIPGHVIQCVHTSTTTGQTSTSSSFVDMTNMTLNITPKATNSFIFISASLAFAAQRTSTDVHASTQLLRDSTVIAGKDLRTYDYGTSGVYINAEIGYSFVDQPLTTSTITYKFQMRKVAANTNAASMNAESGSRSSFVIMEIAQ